MLNNKIFDTRSAAKKNTLQNMNVEINACSDTVHTFITLNNLRLKNKITYIILLSFTEVKKSASQLYETIQI